MKHVPCLFILLLAHGYAQAVVYSTQPANWYDTEISSGSPTTTDGTAETYLTGRDGSASVNKILVEYDLSSIPTGSLCLGATLYLVLTYGDNLGDDRGQSIYSLRSGRSDWVYNQATWQSYKTGSAWGTAGCENTSTDINSSAIATFNAPDAYPGTSTITLNAATVQTWFGASNTNYGIIIRQDAVATNYRKKEWASSRNTTAANRPKLIVEYTTPSPTTTDIGTFNRVKIYAE